MKEELNRNILARFLAQLPPPSAHSTIEEADYSLFENVVNGITEQHAEFCGNYPYLISPSFSLEQQVSFVKDQIEVLNAAKVPEDLGLKLKHGLRLATAQASLDLLEKGFDWTVHRDMFSS